MIVDDACRAISMKEIKRRLNRLSSACAGDMVRRGRAGSIVGGGRLVCTRMTKR